MQEVLGVAGRRGGGRGGGQVEVGPTEGGRNSRDGTARCEHRGLCGAGRAL